MPTDYANQLILPSQGPIDPKTIFLTLNELKDLGSNNDKAFLYFEDMEVKCIEDHKKYIWKERTSNDDDGVLDSDFTYPDGAISYGIDYSNRSFNFFELVNTTENNCFHYNEPTLQMCNVYTVTNDKAMEYISLFIRLPQFTDCIVSGKLEIKNLTPDTNHTTIVSNNIIEFMCDISDSELETPVVLDHSLNYDLPLNYDFDSFIDKNFDPNEGIYNLRVETLNIENPEKGIIIDINDGDITDEANTFCVCLSELKITFKNPTDFAKNLYTDDFEYLRLYNYNEIDGSISGGGVIIGNPGS